MINLTQEKKRFKEEFKGKGCNTELTKEIPCSLGPLEMKGAYYNIGFYLNGSRIGQDRLQKLLK